MLARFCFLIIQFFLFFILHYFSLAKTPLFVTLLLLKKYCVMPSQLFYFLRITMVGRLVKLNHSRCWTVYNSITSSNFDYETKTFFSFSHMNLYGFFLYQFFLLEIAFFNFSIVTHGECCVFQNIVIKIPAIMVMFIKKNPTFLLCWSR